jgi:hypothetical protein
MARRSILVGVLAACVLTACGSDTGFPTPGSQVVAERTAVRVVGDVWDALTPDERLSLCAAPQQQVVSAITNGDPDGDLDQDAAYQAVVDLCAVATTATSGT